MHSTKNVNFVSHHLHGMYRTDDYRKQDMFQCSYQHLTIVLRPLKKNLYDEASWWSSGLRCIMHNAVPGLILARIACHYYPSTPLFPAYTPILPVYTVCCQIKAQVVKNILKHNLKMKYIDSALHHMEKN